VVIALGTGVAGVVVGRYLKRDLIAEDVYAADSLVLLNQRILNAEFPFIGVDRARIIIEADICAPEVLRAVNESIGNMADDKHVAKLEEEAKVSSIIPYLQETVRLRRTVSDIADTDNDRLPDTRAGMSKILRRMYDKGVNGVVSAGEVKSLLSRGQGERALDVALLIVETRDTHGINVGSLLTELRDDLRPLAELGQVKISYAGFIFERYEIVTAMTAGMIRATLTSVLLCTGIVTLLFMSVKYGLITALPIMLIVGWLLGAMYLLGFTLNMVTATITAMGVGLGIDYSIHLVERYRQERAKGKAISESMSQSLANTGPSLLAAAATTISGFLVMAFSRIGMVKSFGILASLVIVFAVMSSMVVLPAMLVGTEKIALRFRNKKP